MTDNLWQIKLFLFEMDSLHQNLKRYLIWLCPGFMQPLWAARNIKNVLFLRGILAAGAVLYITLIVEWCSVKIELMHFLIALSSYFSAYF